MRYLQFLLLTFTVPIFSFEDFELNKAIKYWEGKNLNRAIIVITSPSSGKIEYTNSKNGALHDKKPAGSLLKTFSSFIFLSNSNKFNFKNTKYICKGKFEEPYPKFFTEEDKTHYNLIKDEKSGKYFFRCSQEKGHGEVDLNKALAFSCNAFYLHFASQSPEFFYRTFLESWKLKEENPLRDSTIDSNSKLNTPFSYSLVSIGEAGEIRLTAIELAQLYGAIFAGTPILKPIQIGEMPQTVRPFPFSEDERWKVRQGLFDAVSEGTLKDIHLENTSIKILGGKTGTPTRSGEKFRTHGWNIIYFLKADTPYLLVVFVNNGSAKKEAMELTKIILNIL